MGRKCTAGFCKPQIRCNFKFLCVATNLSFFRYNFLLNVVTMLCLCSVKIQTQKPLGKDWAKIMFVLPNWKLSQYLIIKHPVSSLLIYRLTSCACSDGPSIPPPYVDFLALYTTSHDFLLSLCNTHFSHQRSLTLHFFKLPWVILEGTRTTNEDLLINLDVDGVENKLM